MAAGRGWPVGTGVRDGPVETSVGPEQCRACNGFGVVWRNLIVPQRSAEAELSPEKVQQTARLIFGWKG